MKTKNDSGDKPVQYVATDLPTFSCPDKLSYYSEVLPHRIGPS